MPTLKNPRLQKIEDFVRRAHVRQVVPKLFKLRLVDLPPPPRKEKPKVFLDVDPEILLRAVQKFKGWLE